MANQKNHKEELNVEDVLTQSEAFIVKYKNLIIGAVVVIILIVSGILMYKNLYAGPREEKAQTALFKGQQLFEQDAFEIALNGDSIGYEGFLKVADEFGGTKAANLARAYAGICYMNLGEYEKAIKELDKFSGDDIMVGPSVLGAIGNSYAKLEQLDKATAYLVKAAEQADNNTLSPIFLMQAGNIYEKQGKFADAVKAYTKIKDKYFQSYQTMDIDKYIERANLQK
ncbi:MAG: tetratricopeptide repeat protein [Mediterranea sp.]|jgi:tetratricopeptide (TPR) repeat protein|nr:tetratricopeptide repeat protein [Mediterranea sp.]